MAAGDNPFKVSRGQVTWELEATPGTAPASGAWNSFGPRVGDFSDPGPTNTWAEHRTWSGGREPVFLDLMQQDYGPHQLGTFKLSDARLPGFAWGEEVSAPASTDFDGGALGGSYRRHVATMTTNDKPATMSVQVHDEDASSNASRTTYTYGTMASMELAGTEGGEVTFSPTVLFQKEDTSVAKNTVTDSSTPVFKHYHGYLEAFGAQILRVLSWSFTAVSNPAPQRFYNDSNAKYWYEAPVGDANYIFTARAVVDGKQFSGFSNRDVLGLARNGDIATGKIRGTRTSGQDAFQITIGSSNNALALISAPRVRPAAGGSVVYDLAFATRTAQYEWIDTNTSRYFPS